MPAVSVKLEHLYKSFADIHVVKGLDLEIAEGEFLVLLGPSGCGKTTALRMIAGLETVSDGRILIGGQDVTHVLPKYRNIAMVFQSYALYPHMTVAENIGYPLRVRRVPAAERAVQVREAAAKVDLLDHLERTPRQLSGGQRQRVALARAIVRRPAVFLMDEPLSNLDAKLRGRMRAELKHLQQSLGVTTVYVTHDQIEAMTLGHRVAVMHAGILQQIGPPAEIYNDPANLFVAGFIGSPPMNVIAGRLRAGRFDSPAGSVAVPGMADRDGVILGVRPEDVAVVPAGQGDFAATVYSVEMTGLESIVTCAAHTGTHLAEADGVRPDPGDGQIVARMGRDFAAETDGRVGLRLTPDRLYLFDAADGRRLRA